ncbi:hypothetical protein CHK_0927 [Christensenella hongkongensis]|uniref:Pilin PilJ C-terminal domain-containing protein n=1 Tax=Christensenella hongkongensis TaxID=270498 RepID=A0A0M2NNH4_9FIRM|nr:hypothetical protein CHK_0927 [Christensenella hongkongensis]
MIDGYNKCETNAERQEYLGINNNNFSNDTFRAKLAELMGKYYSFPLTVDSNVQSQGAYCQDKDLYYQVYFVKDGDSRAAVVYASEASGLDSGNRWEAWMVYQNGTWFESQKTHSYNGSHQSTSVSGLRDKDISYVSGMVQDGTQWLPAGTIAEEASEQAPEEEVQSMSFEAVCEAPVAATAPPVEENMEIESQDEQDAAADEKDIEVPAMDTTEQLSQDETASVEF